MTKTEFIEWWLTTQYGSKPEAKRLHWDRKGHISPIWTNFNQIANIQTGKPIVIYKNCDMILGHPVSNGTSPLRRYLKGGRCQKRKGKQGNIQHLIQKVVFISFLRKK